MVYGGYGQYNATQPKGLLNDVELISTTKKNICSKHVRPVYGRAYVIGDIIENEAQTLGAVGTYTKDAAIVCGGKNGDDNLNLCYEFDSSVNRYFRHFHSSLCEFWFTVLS